MWTVLYIAGYGRSGSTLLERLLASHPRIIGTGELMALARVLRHPQPKCACGEPLRSCTFWGPILQHLEQTPGFSWERWQILQVRFESLHSGWLAPRIWRQQYQDYCRLVHLQYRMIASHALPQGGILIDSSKTARPSAWRPFHLKKCLDMPVKMVHLVRDVRGCMWSNIRLDNLALEHGKQRGVPLASLRTVLHWPIANRIAHLYQQRYPNAYLRIRYEDLVEHPRSTLERIAAFVDIDLSSQIRMAETMLQRTVSLPTTHQVSGNRLRFRSRFQLRGDFSWKTGLKWHHHLLVYLFACGLMRRYGYECKV